MEAVVRHSLLYANFTTLMMPQGLSIWAVFRDLKSQFINQWQPHYKLVSGETQDSDKAAIKRVLPHVWVFIKNKSITKTRNNMNSRAIISRGIRLGMQRDRHWYQRDQQVRILLMRGIELQ